MRAGETLDQVPATVSLGLIADDIVVATIRFQQNGVLSDDDRRALQRGRAVVESVLNYIPTTDDGRLRRHVRSVPPSNRAFTETLRMVRDSIEHDKRDDTPPVEFLKILLQDIDDLGRERASAPAVERIETFFDALAENMLARSEELVTVEPGERLRSNAESAARRFA